jgi:hypothetical protein
VNPLSSGSRSAGTSAKPGKRSRTRISPFTRAADVTGVGPHHIRVH